jgi:myo-inositol-1(or 4)-monophosphatase
VNAAAAADREALVALAARLARLAGTTALAGRGADRPDAATKSSVTDMVTEFDRAAERTIVEGIAAARPDDAVVGEEGTDAAGTSGVRWLIDPIDGTTNFLYGLPGWAVSIAACTEVGAVAAAVYLPVTDELFTATLGGGAFLDGVPIHCGSTTDVGQALVATGYSYQAARRAQHAQRMATILPQVRDVRRLGAASVDLCYVAAGRLDAYFEQWLGPWDMAAGELIAREAGCRTGDFSGGPVRPAEVLVANPPLFPALTRLLAAPGIM